MGVYVYTYLWIKIQFLTHWTILLASCNSCMNCMYLQREWHFIYENAVSQRCRNSRHLVAQWTKFYIHSIGMCRMWQFVAFLRSFFHSSLLYTFSCLPSQPTILPSSLTSSFNLFLGLPLNLVVSKFIYNTLLGILCSSILCTCPNQCNLFNLIVSVIEGFINNCIDYFSGEYPPIFFSIIIYWA